jgi:heme A synthase
MVSVLLLCIGACGLARRLASADRISFAAIVTYGFACVAIMIAAAVSGFIIPDIMKRMLRDVPAAAHEWQIVITGIFQINQAFARLYSVAASLAVILWSISALRNRGLGRGVAIYGCVIAPLIILGIGIGHLRLDVHGMAAVMLGQAIWFIVAGSQLCSHPAGAVLPQPSSRSAGPQTEARERV